MKKLVIIGAAAAIVAVVAIAGMAVPVASAGQSQRAIILEKLQEVGAWAVPSTSTRSGVVSKPLVSEKLAGLDLAAPTTTQYGAIPKPLVSEKLAGLDLPAPTTTAVASSSDGFDLGDAGIGAAFLFGVMVLGAAILGTMRRHPPVSH